MPPSDAPAWLVRFDCAGEQAALLEDRLEALLPEPLGVVLHRAEASTTVRFEVYFEGAPERAAIDALLRPFGLAGFAIEPLPAADWVERSQQHLPPLTVGRFTVYDPGRHGAPPGPRAWRLAVPASLAFGTGHHETTRLCLAALELCARRGPPGSVLDLGCGTAILAAAAARLGARAVLASDNDRDAVAVARRVSALNGLGRRIALATADGLAHPMVRQAAPFDLIFANILAAPLRALAPAIAGTAAKGGTLILSGILASQGREIEALYRTRGFVRQARLHENEWCALLLEYRPLRA